MISEPWNTILFVVAIPILYQAIKFVSDKYGVTFNKLTNQIITLVVAFVFVLLSGGFAGVDFPVWNGDLVDFIGKLIFVVGTGWGALVALYELVWDRLFTAVRFVTSDKR